MIKKPNEVSGILVKGFLKIFDPVSKTTFFNGNNAIHYENMSIAMAESLSNSGQGFIYQMAFGNGGTTVDPTGIITYLTPNSTGINSSLYNQTFSKVVDDRSTNNVDPTRNNVEIRHVTGTNYTDVFVTCLLDYGEPAGQLAFDNSTDTYSPYIFDELGLRAYSPTGEGRLLTHVIFHPIQKALNRTIQIDYTVRVQSLSGFIGG